MASSYVIVEPEVEPVTVDEAMQLLLYDDDAHKPLLLPKLLAARERAEFETGRALISQTRRLELHDWPQGDCGLLLDAPPVQSIVAFTYWDGAGWQPVQAPVFELERLDKIRWAVLRKPGQSWPALGARRGARIRVDFRTGFGDDGDAVPELIKQWIVVTAGHALTAPAGQGDGPGEFINRLLDPWLTRV